MTRPRLLDLFCGAGGAAMGYHRAGFDVVGVDNRPQPRYPFEFHQADALDYLERVIAYGGWGFDAIHASPPCQAFTAARVIHGNKHPDLLTPTRELLEVTGLPWVIENVPGAPMRADVTLCGSHFNLRSENGRLIRHRWFEFGFPYFEMQHPCSGHDGNVVSVFGHGGHVYHGVDDWREVMGIDWMTRDELAQAIPPAFTEHIGRQLIDALERAA
jgi:DNA (cytosine-5)-methyltransferase 1